MSFTSELDALLGDGKKKRKKTGDAFTDELDALLDEAGLSDGNGDIAPVTTTSNNSEEEQKRTWFQSGAFEDGWPVSYTHLTLPTMAVV